MRIRTALLCLLFAACNKSPAPSTPSPAAPVAAKPAVPQGLEAPANDPKVVALARAALACPKPSDGLFDNSCVAFTAWTKAKELEGADATLFNLIDDGQERVRFLGSRALNSDPFCPGACGWRKDPVLAGRLVAALAKETSPDVAESLGWRVGRIDVEATKLLAPISAIIKERRHKAAIRKVVDELLFTNSTSRPTYDAFLALTHDADRAIRYDAVSAFWVGGHLSWPETCKMWEEHLDDEDDDIAAIATQHLGWAEDCGANYDALITKVLSRTKSGKTAEQGTVVGLGKLCENDKSKPKQRVQAASLVKTFASDKHVDDIVRMECLDATVSCDKAHGKAFVARFTRDPSHFVSDRAKELAKAK